MIRFPTPVTLKKYGLTLIDWLEILNRQNGVCAVCKREPTTGRLCVDHEHVRGFKNMSPENKRKHVRGLLCFVCNRYYVGRAITTEKSANVLLYLQDYEMRKDAKPINDSDMCVAAHRSSKID